MDQPRPRGFDGERYAESYAREQHAAAQLEDGRFGEEVSGPRETEDPAWAEEAFALLGRFIVTMNPSVACTDERECSICWESLQGSVSSPHGSPPVVRLPCTHAFHLLCIGRWFVDCERSSCPTCRSELGAASRASRMEHHETTAAPPPGPVRLAQRAIREAPMADRITYARPSLRRAAAEASAAAAAPPAGPALPPGGPLPPGERPRPPPTRSVAPAAYAAPRPAAGDSLGRPSRSSSTAGAAASRQAALQAVARQAAAALAAAVRPRVGDVGRGVPRGGPMAGRPPPPPLTRPHSRGGAAAAAPAPAAAAPPPLPLPRPSPRGSAAAAGMGLGEGWTVGGDGAPLSPRQPPAPVAVQQHEDRRGAAACLAPHAPHDPRAAAQATASVAAPAEGGWAELWQQ